MLKSRPANPKIEKLFKIMVRQNASDLHLKVQQPPVLRIGGALRSLKSDLLTDAQIQKLLYELLKPDQIANFERVGSFDFSYEFEGGWRVRINIYKQRGHISAACRLVQCRIPTIEKAGTCRRRSSESRRCRPASGPGCRRDRHRQVHHGGGHDPSTSTTRRCRS